LGEPTLYDLTAAAAKGKLDPLVGRQAEIERLLLLLSRRTQNNPVLIGEPGVGKRALVKGLAQRIAAGEVPQSLLKRRLWVVDVANLITNGVYREMAEVRLKRLLHEGSASGAILFIDNVHRLVGAVGTTVEIAALLKLGVSRGEVQLIGATTPSQYAKFIGEDTQREWAFQLLEVKESSLEETVEILMSLKPLYEAHHHLLILDEALDAAAHLSARYIADRSLPGKALDLLDETGSRVRLMKMSESEAADPPQVTVEDIVEVVSLRTGLPADGILEEERARRQGM
jgi:ATP-dependent Clp protease ATP-binding subunit ClpC